MALPKPGQRVHLAFSESVRTDLRLLECDEAVLEDIINKGVTIKGDPDREAVLVTDSKTYALKFVETSNLQLLLPPDQACLEHLDENQENEAPSATQELVNPAGLQTQVQRMQAAKTQLPLLVGATSQAHIELSEVRPCLDTLHALLSQRPYKGDDEEECDHPMSERADEMSERAQGQGVEGGGTHMAVRGQGLYTLDDMLVRIQASRQQILSELHSVHAIELDGVWRSVDPAYLGQLLELVILNAISEGMSLDALHESSVCAVMVADGYRQELARHCLAVYGTQCASSDTDKDTGGASTASTGSDRMQCDDDRVWKLDIVKVCQYFARKVLPLPTHDTSGRVRPGPGLPLRRFMSVWQAAVPAGWTPDMDMLKGHVLLEGKGPDALVQAFPVSDLPADPASRFSLLFAVRAQWESTDLDPYLQGMQAPGQTSGALLLKYARASQQTPDSPVYFTAR